MTAGLGCFVGADLDLGPDRPPDHLELAAARGFPEPRSPFRSGHFQAEQEGGRGENLPRGGAGTLGTGGRALEISGQSWFDEFNQVEFL